MVSAYKEIFTYHKEKLMRLEKYLEDCRAYALVQYGVYLLAPREVIQEALDLHGKVKRIVKEQEV